MDLCRRHTLPLAPPWLMPAYPRVTMQLIEDRRRHPRASQSANGDCYQLSLRIRTLRRYPCQVRAAATDYRRRAGSGRLHNFDIFDTTLNGLQRSHATANLTTISANSRSTACASPHRSGEPRQDQ
jgi:hypothetical protein